jgi:hypothetical protein
MFLPSINILSKPRPTTFQPANSRTWNYYEITQPHSFAGSQVSTLPVNLQAFKKRLTTAAPLLHIGCTMNPKK